MCWPYVMQRADMQRGDCSAVINRYGFNNNGVDAMAAELAAFRRREAAGSAVGLGPSQVPAARGGAAAPSGRVGVNLGKNKVPGAWRGGRGGRV